MNVCNQAHITFFLSFFLFLFVSRWNHSETQILWDLLHSAASLYRSVSFQLSSHPHILRKSNQISQPDPSNPILPSGSFPAREHLNNKYNWINKNHAEGIITIIIIPPVDWIRIEAGPTLILTACGSGCWPWIWGSVGGAASGSPGRWSPRWRRYRRWWPAPCTQWSGFCSSASQSAASTASIRSRGSPRCSPSRKTHYLKLQRRKLKWIRRGEGKELSSKARR